MEEEIKRTHVAVMPSPGMGHLIPAAEFAKLLAQHHGVSVTLVSLSAGPPCNAQQAYLDALPSHIRSVQLPPAQLDDLPPDSNIQILITQTVVRSLPALLKALHGLTAGSHLAALVVDLFGTPAFDVAREIGVRPYIFFPSNCTFLSLYCHLPSLDKATQVEYRDLAAPIQLPDCVTFRGSDLPDQEEDRKDEAYQCVLRHCQRYREAAGIFVNSFGDLEPGPISGLKSMEPEFPPVHPVGPLIQSGTEAGCFECLKWLDEQPIRSVLFISFGSGGTLSQEQMMELALGLELSEQRFMWVVRSPSEIDTCNSFFTAKSQRDPLGDLPDGFLRRTEGLGLVVPSWAPQIQVLGHKSTGGFLCHCGWNSALESIVKGVPLIAWPLYAEQKMNALVLSEEMKVAMRPRANERGVVEREEVARVLKAVMEGEEGERMRWRLREMAESGARAVGPGGSSYTALSRVSSSWKDICPAPTK